jgi:antitoxin MazE
MYLQRWISILTMMHLQIAKWGNSLAVRIPADYVRKIGMKEGDHLVAQVGADGALNLRLPAQWSRQAFAEELTRDANALPMGPSVMAQLRQEARY